MNLSQQIRYLGFIGFDSLQGRRTVNHINDLNDYFISPGKRSDKQHRRLTELLTHACKTTPHYNTYKNYSSIYDFPVIKKNIIKEYYENFVSAVYDRSSLKTAITSGSYGTPMTYLHTKEKSARRLAEILYFNRWAGYEVGMKHILIRVRSKHPLKLFIENEVLINPVGIDTGWLEKVRKVLIDNGAKFVVGYPSVLKALATFCRDKGDKPNTFPLEGIIVTAESLQEQDRELVESVFGCPILSRYASEEFGVLAHECQKGRHYHVNLASYFIELLKLDSNQQAEPGEPGRVVVTDLFSHAMPLIRYDTEDVAVMSEGCKCGLDTPVLKRIEGRVAELIYDTSGRVVMPLAVNQPLAGLTSEIIQYQFIQESSSRYMLKMIALPGFPKSRTVQLITEYQKLLGKDAEIIVEYVSSIEPLQSGKRPFIMNKYKAGS